MITKRLFSTLNVLFISGILFVANQSFAQTSRQYANAVSASNTSVTQGSQPTSLAVDGTGNSNLETAARVTTTTIIDPIGGVLTLENNGFIELRFPTYAGNTNVPANTAVYVKINLEQSAQLQALVGGAVGSLLNSVLGIVFGQQGIEVSARNTSGTTVFSTSNNFAQDRLRIVQDRLGNYYIKVTPGAAFNRIRVTNRLSGLLATRWMDVFGAFYVTGNEGCSLGTYTAYNGVGLTSVNLTGPINPVNAIDGNANTFSHLSLGVLAVGSYVDQTVYFEGVPPTATDKFNLKLKIDSGLLAINVLSGVEILGYRGADVVYSRFLNDDAFLSLNLDTTIAANQPFSLQIQPGVVDRIVVRMHGLLNVQALQQGVDIYEINKGSFEVGLAVTGGNANSFRQNVPATITATTTGCNGPFTYSWSGQGLTGNTNVLTVPNDVAPGDYTYSVTVTDAYGVTQTAQTTITVEQPPVAGTIDGATTVCTGDAAPDLTITGYIGSVVRWERSATENFVSYQSISNTTANLSGSTFGALTSTIYVRALIRNNSYSDIYTPTAALTVKTSTWNGAAWSNGIPDIGTTILISGNYDEDTDLSGCSMEVSGGAVVNIPAGRTVTLNKFIKVNGGSSVTFQNNAHLIQQTDVENEGNITLKRNSSSLYRLDYTLWSSPVVGQQLLAFSPTTSAGRFYEYKFDYDATANNGSGGNVEQYFIVDPSTNFETAKGYLIRMPNGHSTPGYNAGTTPITFEGNFTGRPFNGVVTKPLSTQGDRYTAVGNPYPSPINVHAFFDANESMLEPTAALYFWRKKNNTNATSYATLTRDAYVYNRAEGGLPGENMFGGEQWDTFFNVTTPSDEWVINQGQGFFVRSKADVANPVVTFNNQMRAATHNNQFFRTAEPGLEETISRLWIEAGNDSAYSQAALVYSNTATLGMDAGREGLVLNSGGSISFYSIADSNNLTIQARPEFEVTDVVSMGFTTENAGQFSINVRAKDGIFDSDQSIYINDRLTGQIVDITNDSYTFNTESGTFNDRFEILYSASALSTEKPVTSPNSVMVYKEGSAIKATSGNALMNEITIYDLRGRLLYNQAGVNATSLEINNLQSTQQMLIIEINTDKGRTTKKIVY